MHQHLGSLYLFAQCRSRVQFIKIQRRKTTHRKIGKLTKMHQHLGSLYLFAQCRSRVQFIKIQRA
ncbi:hypothetical protein LGW23_07890, partial [Streptococcus mutans]|nr:hypothetical protein [Streptococcus mutans]